MRLLCLLILSILLAKDLPVIAEAEQHLKINAEIEDRQSETKAVQTSKFPMPAEIGDWVTEYDIGVTPGGEFSWNTFTRPEESGREAEAGLLDKKGALVSLPDNDKRQPFGVWTRLKESLDYRGKAHKILWNAESVNWSNGYIGADIRFRLLEQEEQKRSFDGRFERVYFSVAEKGFKQLFREKLSVTSPEPFKDFAWLSFRFPQKVEDLFWVYSPATGKLRELTGPNRSDSLFSFSFSMEDLLGWAGNPAWLKPEVDSEVMAGVPVPANGRTGRAEKSGDCWEIDSKSVAGKFWNFQTREYPEAAAWSPTGVVYQQSRLIRLEIVQADSYSLAGRQVIYVEPHSMLPVYHFVYDREGDLWKRVVNVYGRFRKERNGEDYSYPSRSLIYDEKSGKVTLIDYLKVTMCDSLPTGVSLKGFTPKAIIPEKPVAAEEPVEAEGPDNSGL